MAGPFDLPALSPVYGGALSSGFNPQPGGLSDPMTAGLLSLGASLLNAGGPHPYPVGTGQALGQGIQAGLNTFGAAQHANLQNALLQQQIGKAQLDNALSQGLAGALSGQTTPEQLRVIGQRAALMGHAGGATMMEIADKMEQRQQNAAALTGMRTAPGVLGAGVTTSSPQGRALLSNLTGDPEFDRSVLAAQNEALNSNATATMPAQDVKAPNPGYYSPLFTSPYVGSAARAAQQVLDTTTGLTPKDVMGEYGRLSQQHENAQLRHDIADQNEQLRRDLANTARENRNTNQQSLNDQRTFNKEQDLSKQYNTISKSFRVVLPQVQSAAQYVANGKYDSSGDRALVFQFAKTLDPSDRVGVNDVRDIGKLGNVPERIVQAVQSLAEGKMLPDRVRLDMMNIIRQRFQTMNEQQADIENEYEQRAKNYMLNPRNVVIRYSQRREGGAGGNGWSIREKK